MRPSDLAPPKLTDRQQHVKDRIDYLKNHIEYCENEVIEAKQQLIMMEKWFNELYNP